MGNKQFKLTKLALALGVTVSLAGCFSDNDNNVDIKEPPTDKTIAVLPGDIVVEKQAGSFSIVVTDSAGQPLSEEVNATINFTSNAASVLNTAGGALTAEDRAATGGSFAFTVNAIPADGLSFDYVITADGFLSNSGTVELSSTDTDVADQVRLTARTLEQADGAAPIIATTSTLAALAGDGVTTSYTADGGLALEGADSITLTKDLDAAKNTNKAAGGVSVTLDNGTKFLDKDNQPLQSVPTLTVAYFGNEATRSTSEEDSVAAQDSSLDAFPGGLGLTVAEDDTTNREGSFATGGFVAIELVDENNNKVDNFDGGSIKVAMKIDKNTSNTCQMKFTGDASDAAAVKAAAEDTDTGMFKNGVCTKSVTPETIEVGDIFPVWSYNEDAGKWSFESYGVVQEGDATTYNVAVSVNHLSYWNLDFFTYIIGADKCDNRRLSFDIKDSNGDDSQVYADVLVEANSYRLLIGAYNRTNLAKGTFRNPPSFPVKLKMMKDGVNILDGATLADGTALNLNDNNAASGVQFTDLCDLDGGTLQLTTAPAANIVKPLTPQFVCASNTADVQPTPITTPTIAQLFRGGRFVKTFYPSGQFEVSLEDGDSAAYTVRYKNPNNNTWFTQAIEANTTAATLDIPVACTVQNLTGTGGS
ncbi:hypothetical protein L1285_04670 [Pseudoalteromonas sp. DL2-H2.2]|uniref:hypothetical protein n=1 Tax=Pseudoalteromonas sp. DL2-H2.2 TaxID=2908889 RepID=UPI001F4147CE|nr:hypothetical protein [Pseudoalteromonas sp. DL2-H2.2]MCF2907612.1 hypothetical protein [Pseudoalteromonas sp. DL2-H2.2]